MRKSFFLLSISIFFHTVVFSQSQAGIGNNKKRKCKEFYNWNKNGGSDHLNKALKHESKIYSLMINYCDTVFPNENILKFKHVKELIINGNNQPVKINFERIVELKFINELSFFNINFSSFPTQLYRIDSLKKLVIVSSNISEISDSILYFKKLEYLDMSCNNLSSLPESFSRMNALKEVVLCNNRFSEVPQIFTLMKNLEYIYLENPICEARIYIPYSISLNKFDYSKDFETLLSIATETKVKGIKLPFVSIEEKKQFYNKVKNPDISKKFVFSIEDYKY